MGSRSRRPVHTRPTTAGRRPPGTESTPLYKVHVHPANSTKMSPNTDSCSHFMITITKRKDSYHYGHCWCIYTQCITQENKCYKKKYFETGNTLNLVKHKYVLHRTINETSTFSKLSVIIFLFQFSNGEHNMCIWNIYLLTKYTHTHTHTHTHTRSSDWPAC